MSRSRWILGCIDCHLWHQLPEQALYRKDLLLGGREGSEKGLWDGLAGCDGGGRGCSRH
jgi:hypothetical protein